MRLEEPRWWYRTTPGLLDMLAPHVLKPVAALYGAVATWRYQSALPYRSKLPVICVGNLTAGGTGKTPVAIYIARHLIAQGERPAFLSRGFGGTLEGPHVVDAACDSAARVGDEPLLLARHAPVVVARDRASGAKAIEATDATIIVMDDGLQNPSLQKDLSLAVVDGERGLGNGAVMPAGPLRAPLAFQLGCVDAIVLNGGVRNGGAGASRPRTAALRELFKGPIIEAAAMPAAGLDWLRGRAFAAYAGIGRPDKFFATAERAGARLAARVPFPDHHAFSAADARHLLDLASRENARLLTTEKDLARLGGGGNQLDGALERLRNESETLPIVMAFDAANGARMSALVDFAAKSHKAV